MEEETENKNLITISTPEIIMDKVVINSWITVAPDSVETENKVLPKSYHPVLPVRDRSRDAIVRSIIAPSFGEDIIEIEDEAENLEKETSELLSDSDEEDERNGSDSSENVLVNPYFSNEVGINENVDEAENSEITLR